MFHSTKKPGQEKNRNINKFLDSKKDIHARLKALKLTLDLLVEHEIKPFFTSHKTEIFYVFYEEFTNLEFSGKSKGTKPKEELDDLLSLFEKLLIYLPDEIHERWQFNTISLILRKLLHHGNVFSIREQGIRLFMLWLQIMQDNMDEFNLVVYASIVPGLQSPISKINVISTHRSEKEIEYIISSLNGEGNLSSFTNMMEDENEWCIPEGCTPICPPQQGEKLSAPEELTKKFLDKILDYMTRRMLDVQWDHKHMRGSAFYHVFGHFKRFYLPLVFPLWQIKDRLYTESQEIIKVPIAESSAVSTNSHTNSNSAQMTHTILQCQYSVIRWLIAYTIQLKGKSRNFNDERTSPDQEMTTNRTSVSSESGIQKDDATSPTPSTSSDPGVSSLRQLGNLCRAADIVRSVLYSSPDNVLTIYEIFRQCYLMPLTSVDLMSQALQVFKEWLFTDEKPSFVLEPKNSVVSLSPTNQEEWDDSQLLRTPSYKEAVKSSENLFFANLPVQNSRAGFQANLRLFIAITGQIFFVKQNKDTVAKHSDICRKVMKTYRSLVLEKILDSHTWRQLLTVLLDITQHILTLRPPESRESTLGGQLSSYLLQTLFVTWIRASLQVHLANDLWDHLLLVCSTYTGWEELTKEWSGTMETLTRVMAKTVYRIDLHEPPLLQNVSRKNKFLQRVRGRKTSSGGKSGVNRSFLIQGQNLALERNSSVEVETPRINERTSKKTILPRSVSEPGILTHLETGKTGRHLHSLHSDSCVSTTSSKPMHLHTKVEELIEHQEEGSMGSTDDCEEFAKKQTLAELADHTSSNITSFDSIVSENVFMTSMSCKDFKTALIPQVSMEKDSDDSESTTNSAGAISYNPLKDIEADQESERSSLNIPTSGSLQSFPSFLSESSQNLLGDVDDDDTDNNGEDSVGFVVDDKREDDGGHTDIDIISAKDLPDSEDTFSSIGTSTVSVKAPIAEKDSMESESLQNSGTFSSLVSQTKTPKESPHASLSSEADLMKFDMDAGSRLVADAQSIDSHTFIMLDKDRSLTTLNSDGVSEALEGDGTEEGLRVRFEVVDETVNDVGNHGNINHSSDDGIDEDFTNADESRLQQEMKPRSVIEGGTEQGWTPLSSVVLWQRMLGILGNVNNIKDSEIHGCVFKHLIELWLMLETICRNQGVSIDNKSTPMPPGLTPPLFFCAPWCFQAMSLERAATHKPGRTLAFKLMCMLTTRSHRLKPSIEHMTHFYHFLHEGLTGSDQDVINAIIEQCSTFYALRFQSSSCLFLDFIHGISTIISSLYMSHPRKEAVTLLGSLLCLPPTSPDMKIYQLSVSNSPQHNTDHFILFKDLREKILIPLLKAARNDPSCRARCIALNSLGLFIVEILQHNGGHSRIYECLSLIISSLEFHSRIVSNVAINVLWSLTFYHDQFEKFDKDLPLKIIEAISLLALHIHNDQQNASESVILQDELPEYISQLLLLMLDWVMVIPQDVLLRSRTNTLDETQQTYLGLIMKTFKECLKTFESPSKFERRTMLNINQLFTGDMRPIRLQRVHNDLGMDDPHGITDEDDTETDFFLASKTKQNRTLLMLTARYCISQVLNYYQYFPTNGGAVCPGSLIVEADDDVAEFTEDRIQTTTDEQSLLDSNHIQFLLINGIALLTIIELPQVDGFVECSKLEGQKSVSRLIIRDATGKYTWEVANLYKVFQLTKMYEKQEQLPKKPSSERRHNRNLSVSSSARLIYTSTTDLPKWETVDPNVDRIHQLLRYIGHSSPECLIYPDQQLNVPAPVPNVLSANIQCSAVTSVLKQHNEEENYIHEISHDSRITATEIQPPDSYDTSSPFHVSKMLMHQLGYFSWENRSQFELLDKSEKLLRDIKNLDKRNSRENHKIAVFYVGPGQEDKQSILSNSEGSAKYEQFVSELGWEVELATHAGFMGGLEKNLSTGSSAPYFATHSMELIFHVSTRMPGSLDDEGLTTKLRHLGNDEVHIAWSEHSRDFRRGIINTEFGDVLIIIYPLDNDLYRIQIDRNPKIQPFGPLFDGAIINGDLLATLVRCTAVNAGRAKRATIPGFQKHYEERARCIHDIMRQRVRPTTFEDFCSKNFAPNLPPSYNLTNQSNDLDGAHQGSSFSPRSESLKDPSSVLKFLDMPENQSFRNRTQSAIPKGFKTSEVRVYRASSNTSLNNMMDEGNTLMVSDVGDTISDLKDSKERRKSFSKRFRKKSDFVTSHEIKSIDKIGE